MGQNVGLRKFSGCPKALFQFVIEPEIDVYLLIFRTVKRTASGLRQAASGIDSVPEQHQLRMPVGHTLAAQNLHPGLLRVVQYEGNKLHEGLFSLVASGVGLADLRGTTHAAESRQR